MAASPGHKEESDREHKPVQDRLSFWSVMYGCFDLHHILTGVLNCYHTQPGTSQTLPGVSRQLPSLVGTLFSHTHIYTYSFAKLLFLKLTFFFKGNLENSVLTYNKYSKYAHSMSNIPSTVQQYVAWRCWGKEPGSFPVSDLSWWQLPERPSSTHPLSFLLFNIL